MKVFHHNDNDGRCAAALVKYELESMVIPTPDDFIEYSHTKELEFDFDKLQEGERIYIVDLALDDVIFNVIKECYNRKCKITFIDHHQTTIDRLARLTEDEKTIIDSINVFAKIGISGALLTYVWSCMTEEERSQVDMPFDFSNNRTHVLIGSDLDHGREYHIPLIVRWVDDNDVWTHVYPESKIFAVVSRIEEDLSPAGNFWECIYSNDILVYKKFITPGEYIMKYIDSQNAFAQTQMYSVTVEQDGKEFRGIMYNGYGNSSVFGDKSNEYDVCFIYHENGDGIKTSVYSNNNSEFDCAKYAESMGGGGHKHAAGYFNKRPTNANTLIDNSHEETAKELNCIQKFVKKLFKL